jgi:hypothetical protein
MSTLKGPDIRSIDTNYQGVQENIGAFTSAWRFLNEEDTLDPQRYGKLVQMYGEGLKMFDAWMWAGQYIDIPARQIQVIEEGTFLDTLDLKDHVDAGAAGADIDIVSDKSFGRVGFVVHIPAQYAGSTISTSYRIVSKTYDGGAHEYTYHAEPLLGTDQEIAVEIPAGQKLIVGGSMFAPGTGQPGGLVEEFYDHWHYPRIMKETIHFEGGQQALKELPAIAQSQFGSDLRGRAMIKAQLRLRLQLNDFVLMGYPATRTGVAALTQENRWHELNAVSGDYGLLPGMNIGSMKQYYTGSYNEDHFDMVKFLFASQGVVGMSGLFMQGQELGLSVENSGLNFIKEYSGGHDLYDKMKGIGFNIKEVLKNNFKTYMMEIPEFSNPLLYGADGYNYEPMGMIFPESKVTGTLNGFLSNGTATSGKKVSLNHLTIGYLNGNGENRKLVVGNRAGVNALGIPMSDDWDDYSTYMLTEAFVLLMATNQTILVLRND